MMASSRGPDGAVIVDKPAGPTSHDVVDRARRVFGLRKVGHTGTLDPFATGVLALCLGKATRLARFLSGGSKLYHAGVRFGYATDTDDSTGRPIDPPGAPPVVRAEALRAAIAGFVGPQRQVPPAYSAKQRQGRRLYALARRGTPIAVDPVAVTVHRIDVLSVEDDTATLEVECSPGTYIRALARDLGVAMEVGAHLATLRRLRTGPFSLDAAYPLDALESADVISLRELPLGLPVVTLTAREAERVRHGNPVPAERAFEADRCLLVGPGDEALAVALARAADGLWCPEVVLAS